MESDRSIMDIPEQNDDLPSAYDMSKRKKLVSDDIANSGLGSTNKDSCCNVTSAHAPASLMDRVFSSEMDNTPTARLTTFSMKHPPKISRPNNTTRKISRFVMGQKQTEAGLQSANMTSVSAAKMSNNPMVMLGSP